jgi:hypothetical protein
VCARILGLAVCFANASVFFYGEGTLEAVNMISFVYSLLQFLMLAELMRKNKHLIPHPNCDRFDFTMDQVCASREFCSF